MPPLFEEDIYIALLVEPIIVRCPRFAWICKAHAEGIHELRYKLVDFTQGNLCHASASIQIGRPDAKAHSPHTFFPMQVLGPAPN